MNRWRQRLRGTRVTLGQLGLVSMVSAVVSALIVVGALGETGPEKAVIAALRASQVIHEAGPGSAPTASPASAVLPAAVPTSAPVTPASPSTPSTSAPAALPSGSDSSAATNTSASASPESPGGGSSDSSRSSGNSSSSDGGTTANKPTGPAAKVKHIFVVVVSTPSFEAAFGHGSAATYLDGTLRPKGVLLSGYHSLGDTPLPDSLAIVSGQAPNRDTEQDCPTYTEFASSASPARDGLVPGAGCIYPNTALTVGDQLDGANLHWRAYMDAMTSACQHPNSGAADTTVSSTGAAPSTSTSTTSTTTATSPATSPGAGYVTSENPFVYFHSLLDLGDCQSDDLPLTKLTPALRSAGSNPSYAFISSDPCDGGATGTCAVGKPTGIAASDAFLRQVVPGILASPAYRAGGAVVIVFTPAPATGRGADRPVRTGALVLSPHSRPGGTVPKAYDPYSVLRTVEDVFGLTSLANAKSAAGFDKAVFTR